MNEHWSMSCLHFEIFIFFLIATSHLVNIVQTSNRINISGDKIDERRTLDNSLLSINNRLLDIAVCKQHTTVVCKSGMQNRFFILYPKIVKLKKNVD